MKRALAALALAAVAAPLPGALGPRYGGRIVVGVAALPARLEPPLATTAAERLAGALLHETLVGYGPGEGPRPGLAVEWRADAGGREWTLVLSPWARFHDGEPVRAEDAARALRSFLRSPSSAAALLAERLEGGAAFRAGAAEELPGLETPAPDRLVLRLIAPVPEPLAPLASPWAVVRSASGAGCGPFALASFEPHRRLAAVAAASHPRGRPFLDRVEVVAPPPPGAALRSGPGTVARLASVLLLQLDPGAPPFDRRAARRTVSDSIDRALLAARFLPDGRASAGLLPALLAVARPAPPPTPGRLAGAVTLAVAEDVPPLASQRLVAQLDALGLDVAVRVVDADAARAAPAAARLWIWTPEVAEAGLALRELSALAPAPAAAARALRQAETQLDAALRAEALDEAEAALLQDAAVIPLAALPAAFSASSEVHAARVDAAGRLRLADAWIDP